MPYILVKGKFGNSETFVSMDEHSPDLRELRQRLGIDNSPHSESMVVSKSPRAVLNVLDWMGWRIVSTVGTDGGTSIMWTLHQE